MALSDYERQMLEELEAQLQDEDPTFARSMKPEPAPVSVSRQLSIHHLVLGLLAAVVGIAVLVWGISQNWIWLGVVGVIIMFAGGWYIDRGYTSTPVEPAQRSARKAKPAGGFMDRQAREWEQRRNQQ
ncbi:DUF3040 domain-containing protein [Neoactinobaculum massilliense]|uniref:DUF3040 domain-containing protein n=1 Tax=Neoactinobaculum massilliense TaxID=2364794 RepID=UPI000F5362EB|nr:DUF3040 domain-containing protein [Neoactinobaculum massilliense]